MVNKSKKYHIGLIILVTILIFSFSISPAQADQLTEYHKFENFEVEIAQAENESNGNPITENGSAVYDIQVNATYTDDSYPFIYPIEINYYDITGSSPNIADIRDNPNSYEEVGNDVIYLNPTSSEDYIPEIGSDKKNFVSYRYKTNVIFDNISTTGTVDKDVIFDITSRYTDDKTKKEVRTSVKGPTPAGISKGETTTDTGFDAITDNNYVRSYRISQDQAEVRFQENEQLPSPTEDDLSGNILRFGNMQERDDVAVIKSGDTDFDMVTSNPITPKSNQSTPQTLVVSYKISEGDEVVVDLINSKGQEIVENTDYTLTDDVDDSENCREVEDSDRNVCTFTLTEPETEKISKLGESYMHYKMDNGMTATIGCQMIQTGYTEKDKSVCGYGGVSGGGLGPPSAVISFEEFSGQANSQSNSWQEEKVQLPPTLLSDYLKFKVDITTATGNGYDGDVNYVVAKEDDVGENSFDETVIDSKFDMTDDSTTEWISTFDTKNSDIDPEEFNEGDLAVKFYAYICKGEDSCTPTDYTQRESLEFVLPGEPGFTLRTSDPVNVILDEYTREDITTRYRSKETTDDDYHTQSGNSEWSCISGTNPDCNNPSPIPNFEGTISEKVIVEGITDSDKIQNARSLNDFDNAIQEARDKASNPEGGSHQLVDERQAVVLKQTGREIRFATNPDELPGNPDDWQSVSADGERRAKVDTESKYASIRGGDSFRSVVGGSDEWYPVRPYNEQPDNAPTVTFNDRTKQQMEDPDKCYNCLTAESASEASIRLEDSIGVDEVLTSKGDVDIWQRKNNEPIDKVDLVRNSVDVNLNPAAEGGQYKTFNNYVYGSNTGDNLESLNYTNRDVDFERAKIYNWIRSDEVKKTLFERPEYKSVSLYERPEYNIEYYIKTDVTGEHALHEYRRPVYDAQYNYDLSETVWIDISESTEDTEQISDFSVKFDGKNKNNIYGPIEWNDQIHKTDPSEIGQMSDSDIINNFDACESDVRTEVTDSGYHGLGGEVYEHTCEDSNGDKVVLRVGKKYDEPDVYSPIVDMKGERTGGQREPFQVYVDSETENQYSGSSPNIKNLDPINDNADLNVGMIAIQGTIEADTARLDKQYTLTVTPGDTVGSTGSCDEDYSGYSTDERIEIQQESEAGFVATQRIVCVMNRFTEPSEAPSEFDFYTNLNFENREEKEFNPIPAGAIQNCNQIGFEESGTNCEIEGLAPQITSSSISLRDGSQWSSIDDTQSVADIYTKIQNSEGLDTCPTPYESETEELPLETVGSDADSASRVTCILEGSREFELRNRPVRVQYESVETGEIIESCSEIPVSSETGTHSGYQQFTSGSCYKVDPDDPGPGDSKSDSFALNDMPPGAFRGNSLTTDEVGDEVLCSDEGTDNTGSDTIDEGIPQESGVTRELKCRYSLNQDYEVRYGTITTGTWTQVSSSSDATLIEDSETTKDVWRSKFVYDDGDRVDVEEEFISTINPRKLPGHPAEQDFKFKIIEGSTGDVVDKKTVKVNICNYRNMKVHNLRNLPTDHNTGSLWQCKDFDPLLGGSPVVKEPPGQLPDAYKSLGDALNNVYPGDGSKETVYILSPLNDACPYSATYPRGESQLKSQEIEFRYRIDTSLDRSEEEDRLEEELRHDTMSYYSLKGSNPCRDDGQASLTQSKENRETLVFGPNTFTVLNGVNELNNPIGEVGIERDFIRTATLGDIAQYDKKPSQGGWTNDNIGGIRIGNPVIGNVVDENAPNKNVNDNLVAQYSFDDRDSLSEKGNIQLDNTDNMDEIPLPRKIQDVRVKNSLTNPNQITGREKSIDSGSRDHYSAILWHTTQCWPQDRQRVHSELPETNPHCETDVNTDDLSAHLTGKTAFSYHEPVSDPDRISSYYNEDSGIFAGSSLELDNHTWLMLTPPCIRSDWIGDSASGNIANCEDGQNEDEEWRGGLEKIHDGNVNNLRDEIQDEDGWSISFWVKKDGSNIPSPESNTVGATGSYRTLFSIGVPAAGRSYANEGSAIGNPPYLTETLALNRMYIPKSVDVSGVGNVPGGGDYGNSEVLPLTEPSSAYLEPDRQMAEDCLTYDSSSRYKPPILCDLLVARNSELDNYDQLQGQSQNEQFMRDWIRTEYEDNDGLNYRSMDRKNIVKNELKKVALGYEGYDKHVNYELGLDWEASERTYKNFDGSYSGNGNGAAETADYPGGGSSDNQCGEGYGIDSNGIENRCFDSRYRMDGEITSDGYKGSQWKHMTISYDSGSGRSEVSIYENGELVKTDNVRGDTPQERTIKDGVEVPNNEIICIVGTGASCPSRPYTYDSLVNDANVQQNPTDQWSMHDSASKDKTIDSGRIYRDGVMAIGGQYYDPSLILDRDGDTDPNTTNDNVYRPYVTATSGEFEIDEVRVYDQAMSEMDRNIEEFSSSSRMYPDKIQNHRLDTDKSMFVGNVSAKVDTAIYGDEESNIADQMEGASLVDIRVNAKGKGSYRVDVKACDGGGQCTDPMTISQTSIEEELSTKSKQQAIPYTSFTGEDIEKMRFDIQLGSEEIDESPVINSIEITPVPMFSSCQKLGDFYTDTDDDGERIAPISGADFNATLAPNGLPVETKCDMSTRNGGWTMFSWFEESSQKNEQGLMGSERLVDCDLSDSNCFGKANFTPPQNLNDMDRYEAEDVSQLNPQILIKAKKQGTTVAWAAFELDAGIHHINEDLTEPRADSFSWGNADVDTELELGLDEEFSNYEEIGATRYMSWVDGNGLIKDNRVSFKDVIAGLDTTNGERDGAVLDKTKNKYEYILQNDFVTDKQFNDGNTVPIKNCLHPYATSESVSSNENARCITSYKSDDNSIEVWQTEVTSDGENSGVSWSNREYKWLTAKRDQDGDIDNVECLEDTNEDVRKQLNPNRCELYYSTGDAMKIAGDTPRVDRSSNPPDTVRISNLRLDLETIEEPKFTTKKGSIGGYVITPQKDIHLDTISNNHGMDGFGSGNNVKSIVGIFEWDGDKIGDVVEASVITKSEGLDAQIGDIQNQDERDIDTDLDEGTKYAIVVGGTKSVAGRSIKFQTMKGKDILGPPGLNIDQDEQIEFNKVFKEGAPSNKKSKSELKNWIEDTTPNLIQDPGITGETANVGEYPDLDIRYSYCIDNC